MPIMNTHHTPSRARDDVARALADYVLERTAPPAKRDEFDVVDYIDAVARGDTRQVSRINEQSERTAARLGVVPQFGGAIFDVASLQRRDLTAGGGSSGGFLVGTDQGYAGGLWAGSVIGAVPLTLLTGLQGNVAITATTSISTGWLAGEAAEAPDVAASFGQRTLLPKTVSCVATISHQLDRQFGSGGRAHVVSQLQAAIRQAADVGVLNGSGDAGQPQGIIGMSGIGNQSGTSLAWGGILSMLEAVEGRDVGGLRWIAGTTTARLLRGRERFSGAGPILDGNEIAGIKCHVTRACPADALLLAEWPRVIVGVWGGLEVVATSRASAAAFAAGKIMVRALLSLDVTIEQPSAVARSVSIT